MPRRSSAYTPKINAGRSSQRSSAGIVRRRVDYRNVIQRAQVDPGSLTPQDVLTLQRSIGNQSTVRLLQPVLQAKLKLGPAGDKYEEEADKVADQVVRKMNEPTNTQEDPIAQSQTPQSLPTIQRDPEEEIENPWQRRNRSEGVERGGLKLGGNRQWTGGTVTSDRGGFTIGDNRKWKGGAATSARGGLTLGSSSVEAQKAALIRKIRNDYGIDINQRAGVQAVRDAYPNAPRSVRRGVRAREWTLQELQDVDRALRNYRALLGTSRPGTLGAQPITTFSRLKKGIDEDSRSGVLDNETAGETFTNNISMFDAGTTVSDFAVDKRNPTAEEYQKGFRGTIEHELSHGLIEELPINGQTMVEEFADQMGFWDSVFNCHFNDPLRPSSKQRRRELATAAGVEAPVTLYGAQDAQEDLAETMMFYFEDPAKLARDCPERFAFIRNNVQPILDGNPIP